jgi:LPS O-antigen subunit length determinant protein (WzzB/FepE family)
LGDCHFDGATTLAVDDDGDDDADADDVTLAAEEEDDAPMRLTRLIQTVTILKRAKKKYIWTGWKAEEWNNYATIYD